MKPPAATEVWLDIPGYEGLYQASSIGRIRSLPKVVPHWRGGSSTRPGRVRAQVTVLGYQKLGVTGHDGKRRMVFVHRLVLAAFVRPPAHEGEQCNHKDGNKQNNIPANLEWCNCSQNALHKFHVLGVRPWRKGPVMAIFPDGSEKTYSHVGAMEAGGFNTRLVSNILNGSRTTHKGCRFVRVDSAPADVDGGA